VTWSRQWECRFVFIASRENGDCTKRRGPRVKRGWPCLPALGQPALRIRHLCASLPKAGVRCLLWVSVFGLAWPVSVGAVTIAARSGGADRTVVDAHAVSGNAQVVKDTLHLQWQVVQGPNRPASHSAVLEVPTRPILFDAHPVAETVYVGEAYTFVIAVSGGTPPFRYQWQRDGADIPGATAARYDIAAAARADGGRYVCVVSDAQHAVPSCSAVFQVVDHVTITTEPHGGAHYVGQAHTFTTAACGGKGGLSYQWQHDGADIPGATGTALTINPLALVHAGTYTCTVGDEGDDCIMSVEAQLEVAQYIIIMAAPAPGNCYAGDAHTLYVATAGGIGTLRHQWRKNGIDIPGATANLYVLDSVSLADSGTYSCVVSDEGDDLLVSAPAFLSVVDRIAITAQPTGGDYYAGASHTFTTAAGGGRNALEHQWQKDGADVPGATGATLALEPLARADSGTYTCIVTDGGTDTATTDAAVLAVADHLAIATQPASAKAYIGDSITFTATVTGGKGELRYQWRKDGEDVCGTAALGCATGPHYTLESLSLADAGTYTCIVADKSGDSATTHGATLTVSPPVSITLHPIGGRRYAGEAHTLTLEASGGKGELRYQWRKDGEDVCGTTALGCATGPHYTLESLSLADAGTYTCIVTDADTQSVMSRGAMLSVVERIAITMQPYGGDYFTGEAHTFSASASGGMGQLHYQWRCNGEDVPGATGTTFMIDPLAEAHAGTYTCVIRDSGTDMVTTDPAIVTVLPPLVGS